ncbi:hypothetical protein KI387_019019 [Taxus chinensis]|uniref:U-box domain-containing protein n=1 Tax=Taxus chinensis TaxID=29808 RepID=A0AA38G8G1_TAXCH|nr:hypothetical protein KI387_019019 [Taxus chinensis]
MSNHHKCGINYLVVDKVAKELVIWRDAVAKGGLGTGKGVVMRMGRDSRQKWMDPEVGIPSYFMCWLSLQRMRDPVTVCTGATYDRESIQKWIYTFGKKTCPATMQLLENEEMTTNHTLRRLIQHRCLANYSAGIRRISTTLPLDTNQLLREIQACPPPTFQAKALRKLKSLADQSESNRRCIASSEAPTALLSVIESDQSAETDEDGYCYDVAVACEEALGNGILSSLPN